MSAAGKIADHDAIRRRVVGRGLAFVDKARHSKESRLTRCGDEG